MQAMNDRTRFLATMHYQPRDRCPIVDFGFWPETVAEWKANQGLPAHINTGWGDQTTNEFFGMDVYNGGHGCNTGLLPGFEEVVLEDRGDQELVQQSDGVTVLRKKTMGSIPEHHGHLLVDRESWKKHYLPRLNPATPGRLPADMQTARTFWQDENRTLPSSVFVTSLYGWIRNWMGVEHLSYAVYDDPAFFEEMVTTVADCAYEVLRQMIEAGARFDVAGFWEDMCYNGGPLLAPVHFKKYMVPHYRRLTELLLKSGCDVCWVDCDGKIDDLLPMWLDSGVNCMFPIEIGTWGADPVKFRQQYGKKLLMMGGFDKHILAQSPQAIEKEVMRLGPLVEEGGFIPMPDHRVPPDVPLVNYMHYLRCARRVWGKGVNLKPMHELPKLVHA